MIYYCVIFLISCASPFSLAEEIKDERTGQELLLCRKCGTDVADSSYLISKESPGARKTLKQQLFGQQNVTIQTLVNPFGINFDIVTTEKARCENFGRPEGADSWFPGYAWKICACPYCGQHLGWTFESVADKKGDPSKDNIDRFHGLILSNILGENYKDLATKNEMSVEGVRYRLFNYDAKDLQNVNDNTI